MRSGISGRMWRMAMGVPKPWQRASSSQISYSLLSFQVDVMPTLSSCALTLSRHHAPVTGLVKSRCEPSASQNIEISGAPLSLSCTNRPLVAAS